MGAWAGVQGGVVRSLTHSRLQVNLVVLLAEMFMCFEVLKPDFVQAKDLPDGHGELWPLSGWGWGPSHA